MNTSSRKLSTHTYKKSKKNKNKNKIKNRAYSINKNVIKINIHHPRNLRIARTIEHIKLTSINATPAADGKYVTTEWFESKICQNNKNNC